MSELKGARLLEQMLSQGIEVCSVVQAGEVVGLKSAASYIAAANGSLPILRINGLRKVPIRRLLAQLRGEEAQKARVAFDAVNASTDAA